jgi:hypothetical protein
MQKIQPCEVCILFFSKFVLRAEIVTIFEPKMVTISARNTNILKICKLRKAVFSAFYNISQPNFAILLISLFSF